MIDWIIIAVLIFSGIGLIILEIIFVPGTTIVGIMGFCLSAYGIYRTYDLFDTDIGHWVLAGSLMIGIVVTVISFKSNAWERFSLRESMQAKVNEKLTDSLEIGLVGKSVSSLKPIGKVEFNDSEYEAKSLGNFVDEDQLVKIIKIERNQIFVEPIT